MGSRLGCQAPPEARFKADEPRGEDREDAMTAPAEAPEWHRIIRASVRECLETYLLQAQAGSVTVGALETILARATVPILRQVEERPSELVVALLPSLIRTMLAAFVEVMAEQRQAKPR